MFRYILKRVGYSLLTLWALITITFFLMRALPGDPFIGPKAISEATKQALYVRYGLDKPMIVQYGKYMINTLTGDLGSSLVSKRPVTSIISETFPYSFELGVLSLIFAAALGIILGIYAARHNGRTGDTVAMIIAVIGVSVPSFIVASLLQYGVSLKVNEFIWQFRPGVILFPVSGWNTPMHKILPAIALGFSSMATISRLMRTSMLDVLGQDYIKTAKAKGLSERVTVWKHAVRNALMPVITVLGPMTAAVLTGAFVVEKIFNIPGMGRFFVTSITSLDYPVISGTTMFYGAFLIVANLVVDIVYGLVDPRVKLGKESE